MRSPVHSPTIAFVACDIPALQLPGGTAEDLGTDADVLPLQLPEQHTEERLAAAVAFCNSIELRNKPADTAAAIAAAVAAYWRRHIHSRSSSSSQDSDTDDSGGSSSGSSSDTRSTESFSSNSNSTTSISSNESSTSSTGTDTTRASVLSAAMEQVTLLRSAAGAAAEEPDSDAEAQGRAISLQESTVLAEDAKLVSQDMFRGLSYATLLVPRRSTRGHRSHHAALEADMGEPEIVEVQGAAMIRRQKRALEPLPLPPPGYAYTPVAMRQQLSRYPFCPYQPRLLMDAPSVPSLLPETSNSLWLLAGRTSRRAAEHDAAYNAAWRTKFPWLCAHHLTWTKLRRMQQGLLSIGEELELEPSTVAMALVYLEKAILAQCVDKGNRRVVAAAALLLAAKFNDDMPWDQSDVSNASTTSSAEEAGEIDERARWLRKHMSPALRRGLSVSLRATVATEFSLWSHLGFSLHVPPRQLRPHLAVVLSAWELEAATEFPAVHAPYSDIMLDGSEPPPRRCASTDAERQLQDVEAEGFFSQLARVRRRARSESSTSSSDSESRCTGRAQHVAIDVELEDDGLD